MSTQPKDGGPAFPEKAKLTKAYGTWGSNSESVFELSRGMSLRDWFAAMAMQGFISSPIGKFREQVNQIIVSEHAYRVADAMLAARERKEDAT